MFNFIDELLSTKEYPKKETLLIEEISIQIIRTKRKSVSLQIKPQGCIMRAPLNCPTSELKRFAKSKLAWLRKRTKAMEGQLEGAEKQYVNGENFQFKGETFQLKIEKGNKGYLSFNSETKTITVIAPPNSKDKTAYIKRKIHTEYKTEALRYLEKRCEELSQQTGLKYKSIKVRDYKARWGSCSHTGELSFNWRIIMAPLSAIDSVIYHELAHTKHFNHSKRFWTLVDKHCPDYQESHQYFQDNQYRLMF